MLQREPRAAAPPDTAETARARTPRSALPRRRCPLPWSASAAGQPGRGPCPPHCASASPAAFHGVAPRGRANRAGLAADQPVRSRTGVLGRSSVGGHPGARRRRGVPPGISGSCAALGRPGPCCCPYVQTSTRQRSRGPAVPLATAAGFPHAAQCCRRRHLMLKVVLPTHAAAPARAFAAARAHGRACPRPLSTEYLSAHTS